MRTMQSLAGTWEFRFDDEHTWRDMAVPGCWDEQYGRKNRSGPAWYRTRVALPPLQPEQRVWLLFDAVSYHCEVFVHGHAIGEHTGLWDAFRIEIPRGLLSGHEVEICVKVEKPAGLLAGPDSASVPGRFPLRSTLVGFLPYVWGQIFGGIWQDVHLAITGPDVLGDLRARGAPDGQVVLSAGCSAPTAVTFEIRDPSGNVVATDVVPAVRQSQCVWPDAERPQTPFVAHWAYTLDTPQAWSLDEPALYSASAHIPGDTRTARFGLRSISTSATTILLNGRPIYPRMLLSWGWYADLLHSNPGPERVRAELQAARQMGYNGMKLCLWLPPAYFFDIADELGMLLWIELPMWLPQPDAHFRRQLPREYEAMVRQSCDHPSVMLYTLGCELNRMIGPEILEPLYAMVKHFAGDALVRDNSGSGEAYGGLLNEYADFYDYHFYSDLHYFRELIDYFTPRWRPIQPWVFGEFCDLDTFRNVPALLEHTPPWWLSTDPEINPQGARWQFDVPYFVERLRERGLWERSTALEELSWQHALLHRKWTIETVRSYREIGGYVITGQVDTPISTAGMWNDLYLPKFAPEQVQAFNADTILTIGWGKRRAWINGGDRAAYWDTWSYEAGAHIRAHLIVSHYGSAHGKAEIRWHLSSESGERVAQGEHRTAFDVQPGDVREVALAECMIPATARAQALRLEASITIDGCRHTNSWRLWSFPQGAWSALRVALFDPRRTLQHFEQIAPGIRPAHDAFSMAMPGPVLLATEWNDDIAAFVQRGGRAIVLQGGASDAGPLPVVDVPFWREAVRVCEPHQAWGDFPHAGWADLQFFGCATDAALDTAAWPYEVRPILRRIDVRTLATHAYAAELAYGAGRMIVSTLRFQGGHGEQPAGITRNSAARYLLACWVRYLSRG